MRKQSDEYDPWTGVDESAWTDNTNWPADFRGNNQIDDWYGALNQPNKKVYQWSTDIFNNQYFLLKDRIYDSLYEERIQVGELWSRSETNLILPISAALSGFYDTVNSFSENAATEMANGQIKSFEVWFDTMMIETPNFVLFSKLNFDFENNDSVFTIADEVTIYELLSCDDTVFAGTWFYPEEKKAVMCNISNSTGYYYPIMYNLDLETFEFKNIFTDNLSGAIQGLSAFTFTEVEKPVFTYNNVTKTYDVSFKCETAGHVYPLITTIKMNDEDTKISYNNVSVIVPNL